MFDYIADTLKIIGTAFMLVFFVGYLIEEKSGINEIEAWYSLLWGVIIWLIGLAIKFGEEKWKKA